MELTSQDIIVAPQILGGRVDDNVRPKLDGPLVDGSGEGAVNADHRPVGMTELGDEPHIHASQVGVGGALRKEEGDIPLLKYSLQGGHVGWVDDCCCDAHLGQDLKHRRKCQLGKLACSLSNNLKQSRDMEYGAAFGVRWAASPLKS